MDGKELGLEAIHPNDGFGEFPAHAGITLRQHYAGLAMQGFAANPAMVDLSNKQIAKCAVDMASDLLAALTEEAK